MATSAPNVLPEFKAVNRAVQFSAGIVAMIHREPAICRMNIHKTFLGYETEFACIH